VIRAIRHDRMEVVVAPIHIRAGANFATLAPAVSAFFQQLAGGPGIAERVTAEQVGKRPED
jgi:hypothetical protein